MKSVILNVRIPHKLKDNLERDSVSNDISLSDHVRNILSSYFEVEENIEYLSVPLKIENYLYNSSEFIFLVTWMFEKRLNPYDTNQKEIFIGLKQIVLNIINDKTFSLELRQEFEKVFADLTRFINEIEFTNNHFHFPLSNYSYSFNYYLLINFIYKKAFENKLYL